MIDEAVAVLVALREELLAVPAEPVAAGFRCAHHGWVASRNGECSLCWADSHGQDGLSPRPVPGTARNPRLRERFAAARSALRSDGLPV